jgi:hypothetical protein
MATRQCLRVSMHTSTAGAMARGRLTRQVRAAEGGPWVSVSPSQAQYLWSRAPD